MVSDYFSHSAVITGISSGIGRAAVEALLERGWRVFGSVRKESDADDAIQRYGDSFTPLIFDVTDESAINDAAEQVSVALEGRTLSGLVNNAGVALGGPLRYIDLDVVRKQFDINLFGAIRTTQAFVPLLGADQERTGPPGKIINMSSVAGKIATPFLSPYAMSKHALEAFSASLRRELLMHGIDVVVVGPGAVKTPIWNKGEELDVEPYLETEYAPLLERMKGLMKEQGEIGIEASKVGELVADILTGKAGKTRYAIMRHKLMNWIIPRLIPERLLDIGMADRFGINKRKT
ncbi:MAG: SDR family oxidoreductase [Pseudomonadota bacterium]